MAKSNPEKSRYKVVRQFSTKKKVYKPGKTIYLTDKGYKYLKSQKIVE